MQERLGNITDHIAAIRLFAEWEVHAATQTPQEGESFLGSWKRRRKWKICETFANGGRPSGPTALVQSLANQTGIGCERSLSSSTDRGVRRPICRKTDRQFRRPSQPPQVVVARDFDRAHAPGVLGPLLNVEQSESARFKVRHQVDERNLRRIALEMEHALGSK